MRWDDGMRKILSPIGRGFVLYEYKPGRPLDGVPTRIRAAAPADPAKLAEHLQGREDVAQQMVALAEAAGIDPAQQQDAGWGRTFARWAWPFGEDEAVATSDDLLQREFEVAKENDPWWWPFWSENASEPTPVDSTETVEEIIEEETDLTDETQSTGEEIPDQESIVEEIPSTEVAEEEDEQTEQEDEQAPQNRRTLRDWAWPF